MVLAVPPEHVARPEGALRGRGGRGDRPRPVRRLGPARAPLPRADRRRPGDGLPPRRAARGRPRGDLHAARRTSRSSSPDRDDYTGDLLAILADLGRLQQGVDRPPVRPRGAGADRDQAAGRRRTTTGRATPRSSCRSGARRGAWPSPAGSTRATASSTPTRWPAASSTRRSATAWPSAPTPSGSPSSTTSAGATPSVPRPSARSCWPRKACHDLALAYGTPFISGKDSLYNEYTHEGQSLAIPPTLLISAIGQVPDVRTCVTMDLKEPGNVLLVAGMTRLELGGSHWALVQGREGGRVPRVDPDAGPCPLPRGPRGDRAGPGPELPRPERGGAGRRPGRDGLRGRPGRPRLAPRRAVRRRTPRATSSCCSRNPRPDSSWKSAPSTSATVADLFGGLPLGRLGEVAGAEDRPARLPLA